MYSRCVKLFKTVLSLVVLCTLIALAAAAQDDPAAAAVELFNAGQDAHEKGDLKKAVELYEAALKQIPEFPEAEYQMGTALAVLGRRSDAEAAFRRALELRDGWTLPMTSLGSLLLDSGKFAEAETLLTKAVESDEQNYGAFSALAELRLRTKAAAPVLQELLGKIKILTAKANPTASIWLSRSALELALDDPAAAWASVGRALAIEPKSFAAALQRGEIALAMNDATAAIADGERLLKSEPSSDKARFLFARALAADGRIDEAIEQLGIVKDPTPAMADFRERIRTASSENVAELEKKLESDPTNGPLLGRLCNVLRTANPQRALGYCRLAYETDRNNINYVIGFAAALVQAKQFENAVTLLNQIVAAAPDNYTAHANLAVALFQLKRYAEAKREYNWIVARQPDTAVAYYYLGIIHDQLKEYPDAMANYQTFLKIADPELSKIEIDKVNLRLPILQKQLKNKR